MIRKTIILSLLLVYITVTTGFSMNTHFCYNKIAGVTFNTVEKAGCGKMAKPTDCCRDNHISVKVSDNHEVLSNNINIQAQSLLLFILPFQQLILPEPIATQNNLVSYHSPPLHQGIPLTIVHSVFRI